MKVLRFLQSFVPPIVSAAVRRLQAPERAYVGSAWPANARADWDDDSIEEVVRRNWPTLQRRISGTGDIAVLPHRSSERDLIAHNTLMTFLYVLARASRGKDNVAVLDWGGMLGHYALVARHMLPEVTLDYLVKERLVHCRLGRELNPSVSFIDSDDTCFARRYDIVMANGAVHYVEDWRAMIGRLAAASTAWLMITCQPTVYSVPGFVVVQRLRHAGFKGQFYSHVFNRDDLIQEVSGHGFILERELMSWGVVRYRGAPEHPIGAGFLFRRR